jgi:hypothetical protein
LGSDFGTVLKTSRREERACKKLKWEGGRNKEEEENIIVRDTSKLKLTS